MNAFVAFVSHFHGAFTRVHVKRLKDLLATPYPSLSSLTVSQ